MKLTWYLLIFLSLFFCINSIAQERIYIDFGSSNNGFPSSGNINNISNSVQGSQTNGVLLFNNQGISSGINLQVHDAWMNISTSGTTTPDYQLNIPQTASRDSFFGATGVFNGATETTGGFKLRNLDPTKYYSFSFFASRMNVNDNRESAYTVTGSNTQTTSINPSNNINQRVILYNTQPDSNGEITITATSGANNTNSSGFYYLNAIELEITSSPISQLSTQTYLQLTHPITTPIWEIGKIVEISWNSVGINNITLDYSTDGGSTFNFITTLPATDTSYDFTVPNQLTSNAIIRISDGAQTIDSAPITVIPNDGTVYRIVVLGSSTAAGNGPSSSFNAWVWKYTRFLEQLDTRYEVINLAQGGFVTYNILPTGTSIPSGINITVNTDKNITKAVSLNAHGIIINLPSNDAASSYPVTDQLSNYNLIAQTAAQNQIPLWVTTPQPRNFGINSTQLSIQTQMVTETYNTFGNNTIDFWSGLGNTTGNSILLPFDSGDGVHATNEAHQIFYERLLLKNVHGIVKSNVDAILSTPEQEGIELKIYPNPVNDWLFIDSDQDIDKIEIYNSLGQLILEKDPNNMMINLKELQSGFYIVHFKIGTRNYQKRLLKK